MNLSTKNSFSKAAREFLAPPFVLAVILLGTAAVVAGPLAHWLQFKSAKKPLPLKASMSKLDVSELAPFIVAERHLLDATMLDALGTEDYVLWTLEDTSLPAEHPLRTANLFVTYYSGGVDLVPHTPDACYFGAGYEQAQRHENVRLEVAGLPTDLSTVPARVCTFRQTSLFRKRKLTVVYTFNSNGRFVCTRTGVRLLVNDPMETYAYFSKVEVRFPRATRAQSVEGSAKLLERVLPVLIRDHWPDIEAARAATVEPVALRSDRVGAEEVAGQHPTMLRNESKG